MLINDSMEGPLVRLKIRHKRKLTYRSRTHSSTRFSMTTWMPKTSSPGI